ncbi:pentapeptide repeat-containing protein [Synechocystis sp. LKSZ1]|uniref:pentapeptide repeat-containing protein n=1 Tax=Synechocystis sp. LKSZ1 TaxID=3144951 RepID=UPI00336BB45E
MPDIHLLEIQNPYANGILMDLEARVKAENTEQPLVNLVANLSLQEQWLNLASGRLKFALKTGQFNLQIHSRDFTPALTPASFPRLASVPPEFHWQILPAPGQAWLKLSSQRLELGSLPLSSAPCHIIATLTLDPVSLVITDAEGLWRPDLSPNKHGIIERLLAQFLVKQVFPPALSWVQLSLGQLEIWEDLYQDYRRNLATGQHPSPEDCQALRQQIEQIYQATTEDLHALARLAGLDPQLNLAGGKFVGASLQGIELHRSDLSRSNFRGAILTDADLSEADLSFTNLSGADLSGAYLEGANLRGADCHRSSLALGNLIGADLTDANLVGTSVQNANLTNAIVTNTRFGDNPGMTASLQASLLARGAKFVIQNP